MKSPRLLLVLTALLSASLDAADATPHAGHMPEKSDQAKAAPARHPLKGVIVDVVADKTSLLVKHEEIPGVMRAMTMLLKVTESELKSVQKGQAVTGLLVRKPDGWWLEEVKAATP
jgi:Cu/Ag efflux protein CusF